MFTNIINYDIVNVVITMSFKINEKTKKRIENYKNNLKEFKLFMFIIYFIFILFFLIEFKSENILNLILILIGLIIVICIIDGTFKDLVNLVKLNKDINKKRIGKLTVSSKPIKIKFVYNIYRRSYHVSIEYIKIYFKDKTLILPFENDIYLERSIFYRFRRKYKLNELMNKLINDPIISKIAYLKKSKVILSGGLKYYKIINEWFSSKVVYSLDI